MRNGNRCEITLHAMYISAKENLKKGKGKKVESWSWTFLLLFLFPANFLLFTRAHVQGEQRAEVLIARGTVIYVGCIRNSLGQVADDV